MSNIILNEFIINIISISLKEVIYYNHKNGQPLINKCGKAEIFETGLNLWLRELK